MRTVLRPEYQGYYEQLILSSDDLANMGALKDVRRAAREAGRCYRLDVENTSVRRLGVHGAPCWRKQGISERLHEALLKERTDDLAVLLVDVNHPKVQVLYESSVQKGR
ncbi:hypothetical protein [Streptomyces massasporeus]|uniref:hypothetical protein n=1 Tax=Streptomyces massasporeus TaxID=67324 RepID=UPI00369B0BA4